MVDQATNGETGCKFQRAPYAAFVRAVEKLKVEPYPLCEKLGYSPERARGVEEGRRHADRVAAQLCDAWVAAAGAAYREKVIVVRAVTAEQRAAVMSIVTALAIDHLEV